MKKSIFKLLLVFVVSILMFTLSIKTVMMATLENGSQVKEDDELTYYINVYYDGKDVYGIESSTTTTAMVNSQTIHVEDKLPKEVVFDSFVTNGTDQIGAANKNDGSSCLGYVAGGVNGLKYDETTHTVSFDVKSLQAGCVLTVGIKTITPTLNEGVNRIDFYNTAFAQEGLITKNSNTVHAWVGKKLLTPVELYTVKYEYSGQLPENVIALPSEKQYSEGTVVNLDSNVKMPGYIFSGWQVKSGNVTIENGTFTMPNNEVVLVGSFTKDDTYKPYNVSYRLTSTDNPENYILPKTKEYYPNENVRIDVLEKGTILNGYRFSGWTIENNDVVAENQYFVMPQEDVTLVGSWELVTYKVEYQFMGSILPNNSNDLLPATKSYRPGTKVELEDVNDTDKYVFMGWYYEETFDMPEKDIVIYGEWKVKPKYFVPTITTEVVDKKDYFSFGDKVIYETTVTAPNDVDLKDIYVKENNPNIKFLPGEGYTVLSDQIILIHNLNKGESIKLNSEYVVTTKTPGTESNTVEIIGAITETDDYELNRNQEYKASDDFKVDSRLELCNKVIGNQKNQKFVFNITGEDYKETIELGAGECQNIYLKPGTYKITEQVPDNFILTKVEGSINENDASFTTDLGENHKVTFTNTDKTYNPGTNDNIIISFITLIASIIGLGLIFVISKNKKILLKLKK